MHSCANTALALTAVSVTASSCMSLHTFAQINLVTTLDRVLSKVPICETFEIHQSNLASSNLDIRESINDIWYQTCMCSSFGKQSQHNQTVTGVATRVNDEGMLVKGWIIDCDACDNS